MGTPKPPLIVHVIHELAVGGLENGLVNLINHIPSNRYRHAIICMTRSTDFRHRINAAEVDVVEMNRDDAPLWRTYLDLVRVFRRLRPAIVHSRNLSGLDSLVPAFLARVPVRVHGEHGRDADDLLGKNPKYLRLRRLFRPFVSRYTTVSKDLARYLIEAVRVSPERITQIYNGVDTEIFRPRLDERDAAFPIDAQGADIVVIGTVGRLQPVKDQATLVRSFAEAIRIGPEIMRPARLVIVGDGPYRHKIQAEIQAAGIGSHVSMLGTRDDIADVIRSFDLFVLPSLAEGISNTILEALASGLPVLATRVGGNPELIIDGEVGQLVEAGDWRAMANWLIEYTGDAALRRRQGCAARARAQANFSVDAMVKAYLDMYDNLLQIPVAGSNTACLGARR